MINVHELKDRELDLSDAISRHSADKTVAYKTVFGEPIYLGYYLPKDFDRENRYPLFVFVHGGGWASHMIFPDQPHWQGDYLGYLARYYADRGFVSVSIDYRLSRDNGQAPHYEILDCYEDCCDAMDYVMEHAEEYAINTEEIYLLGESAGGHLAGALATFHYDRTYPFKKAFLVNPITHFEDQWQGRVPCDSVHPRLKDLSFEERAKFLAPLEQICGKTCEAVLIHGEEDNVVNPEHSRRFHDRMAELGRPCEVHMIEKTSHAFLLAEYSKNRAACKIGIEVINQALEG
ncbi:MAG: alpha/beta hydrolase [Lachnospiraceae bacterium]|nr:alpha/beta hydrolase [Lachnospiraceae bacterium]